MADYKGVLIFAELTDGKLSGIAQELLGVGRKLADALGEGLSAVVAGSGVGGAAQQAIVFGADKVYVVDDALLKDYLTDSYVAVMQKVVEQAKPQILLMGHTNIGRDLAPKLAFKLGTGLATDCVELSIDPNTKKLLQTRPVYGGNARATFTTEGYPQIATARAKAFSALEKNDSRKGEVVPVQAGLSPSVVRTKLLNRVKEEAAGIRLEDARIIVCGGRGLGGPDNFKLLEVLAKLLGGAVGASRPPCDNNWVPTTLQIGLTGKIVTPEVYFAVGISGASQHMAGCSGAKHIIAINKDPEANIFREAEFGVVGDLKAVVPALTEKVKELLQG
jgi:electron transfer flavoprotein alpha subunit